MPYYHTTTIFSIISNITTTTTTGEGELIQIEDNTQSLFDCSDTSTSTKAYNYLYLYIISIVGLFGNLLVIIFFYKQINKKSTNRAYIIAIAITDIMFILIYFLETKYTYKLKYNFICQLNNYLMNSSKNLSAILLLVCLMNNLIRISHGSYTLGIHSCYGQACSKPSILFTVLTVMALSYYNLWNKSLNGGQSAQTTTGNANCCGFVQEFNPEFTYKLENGILFLIYFLIFFFSIVIFILFYLKRSRLRCNVNRDPVCEKDMIISILIVAFTTSILQMICLCKLFIEFNFSVSKLENLMKNIDEQQQLQDKLENSFYATGTHHHHHHHGNTGATIGNNDLSEYEFEKLAKNFYSNEKEISNGVANFDIDAEYMSLLTFSFKIIIYLFSMTGLRSILFKILRVKFKMNPFVFCRARRQSMRTTTNNASKRSTESRGKVTANEVESLNIDENTTINQSIYSDDNESSSTTTTEKNKLYRKTFQIKLCSFRLDRFKTEIV